MGERESQMLKYKKNLTRSANVICDSMIAIVCMFITFWIRSEIVPYFYYPVYQATINDYLRAIVVILPLINIFLYVDGLYPTNRLRPFKDVFWIIFKVNIRVVTICVIVLYLLKIDILGRLAIGIFSIMNFVMLLTKEFILRRILMRARLRGDGLRNVLIFSDKEFAPKIINKIREYAYFGLNIKGVYFLDETAAENETISYGFIKRDELEMLQVNTLRLFQELESAGYITKDGVITQTFQNLQSWKDVVIAVQYMDKREAIYKTLSRKLESVKIFKKDSDIHSLLLENNIDNAVIAVSKQFLYKTEEFILTCEEFGAEIWLYADLFELMFAQKEIDILGDIPILVFKTTPMPSWPLVFKRIIDIVGALILIILTLPITIFTVIVIKITSPGPIVFAQKRVGLHGRLFTCYKFRSMVVDAEARRKEILNKNFMKGPVFKIKDDPRITPFGNFIRKTSIDELPQLWNVLEGDMSLVGPRPPIPSEVAEYRGWQRRRLSMRPGITCLWQVEGRNKITDFDKWAELDLNYIDRWSLWLDFVILFRTVFVVLFKVGAE
ncbi:exopolysaccharide biosynthesis polyprenyl glycosylphosphotransferase [Candidatus Omnitrophus magneticus]|uniref:Exopolysaccharide biosynthesis polyprenyl glycosylphosphotransferase n=1 Tax=Candidatus Omnitrophus magneticus TaxID=1609969 RepID=A0A0F0CJ92_9BACT|nr:exopolysaccharide biosynthesis polyprenyl glycosylphosphotransferase [Candidatus Omnitrophus magneticus]